MEALRQHAYLTERSLRFFKGPLLLIKLVEVAVTIEYANATSSKATVDTTAKVAALLMRLLEQISATGRELDDSKIWKMLHQLAGQIDHLCTNRNTYLPTHMPTYMHTYMYRDIHIH